MDYIIDISGIRFLWYDGWILAIADEVLMASDSQSLVESIAGFSALASPTLSKVFRAAVFPTSMVDVSVTACHEQRILLRAL